MSGTPRLPTINGPLERRNFWVSLIGVSVAVLVIFVGVILQMGTLANNVEQAKFEAVNAAMRLSAVEDQAAGLRNDVTALQNALKEIETQFCGSDNVRNQIQAYDLRMQALLWAKVYGQELPLDNAYYPQIGRCGDGSFK